MDTTAIGKDNTHVKHPEDAGAYILVDEYGNVRISPLDIEKIVSLMVERLKTERFIIEEEDFRGLY